MLDPVAQDFQFVDYPFDRPVCLLPALRAGDEQDAGNSVLANILVSFLQSRIGRRGGRLGTPAGLPLVDLTGASRPTAELHPRAA